MSKSDPIPVLGVSCFVLPSVLGTSDFEILFAFISPGGSEFLLIMLVLILLFGAQDAPRIFRTLHTTLDKIQRAAASFRYKIMYGDLHQGATDDAPYDVDTTSPDESEECAELEPDAPAPTPESPASETENSDPEIKT
jgi:Sec-independent protein translocase protein TatA